MKNNYRILILIILAFCLLLSSCKVIHVNEGIKEELSAEKLIDKIEENKNKYNNFSYNISAELMSGEEKQNFSGTVRIIHDSIIWISLRSLNIEGARLVLSQDSVIFLNRLEKEYLHESVKDLQAKYGTDLNLGILESVFSNNFFLYPEPEDKDKAISKLKISEDSSYYILSSISKYKFNKYYVKNKRGGRWEKKLDKEKSESLDSLGNFVFSEANDCVFQRVKILPDIYKVAEILIENHVLEQSFYIKYYDFIVKDEKYYPSRIKVEILTSKFDINLSLKLESLKVNQEKLKTPIKIPTKYLKIK